MPDSHSPPPVPWMKHLLLVAAVYNIAWGCVVMAFPLAMFDWLSMEPPRYPQIWQCVGMIVGVYGVGYGIAAFNPARHWPIVLVGLLGKVLGPVGFVWNAWHEQIPWSFGWINVTNDLIWWIPFGLILWHAYRVRS